MKATARTIGRIAAFGVFALLLSACLKLDMDLEVSSDDTVSGTVVFAVQKELLNLAGGSVEDLLGTDAPLPDDVEGVTAEEYEDEEFAGQQFTFDEVPLSQFNQEEGDEQLRIVREGDRFHVTGVLDLSSGLTGATGATGFGLDPEQLLQGAELRIRMTFPGDVIEANGEVDGNVVTWEPSVGERLELEATASAVGGGVGSNLAIWLIVGAVVLAAAVVVAVVLTQRRRPAAAGGPPAGEPPPAGPTTLPTEAGHGSTAVPPPAPPPPGSPGAPPPPPPEQPGQEH